MSMRANEIVNTARNIVQYSDLSRSSPIPLRVIRKSTFTSFQHILKLSFKKKKKFHIFFKNSSRQDREQSSIQFHIQNSIIFTNN